MRAKLDGNKIVRTRGSGDVWALKESPKVPSIFAGCSVQSLILVEVVLWNVGCWGWGLNCAAWAWSGILGRVLPTRWDLLTRVEGVVNTPSVGKSWSSGF